MAVVHLSPELPRVTVRGHKREPSDPTDLLGASLTVAADGDDSPGLLQRSYSGRPRSSSSSQALGANNGNNSKQRKSLRGLTRSRPVSWINKTKGDGTGHNRKASSSEAEDATTQQIDNAFTRIREQLVSNKAYIYTMYERFSFTNNRNKMYIWCISTNSTHNTYWGRKGEVHTPCMIDCYCHATDYPQSMVD